jgi:hypothetical protein
MDSDATERWTPWRWACWRPGPGSLSGTALPARREKNGPNPARRKSWAGWMIGRPSRRPPGPPPWPRRGSRAQGWPGPPRVEEAPRPIEHRIPARQIPTPGAPGEKRTEPGATQVAGRADTWKANERPPEDSDLRSLAAEFGAGAPGPRERRGSLERACRHEPFSIPGPNNPHKPHPPSSLSPKKANRYENSKASGVLSIVMRVQGSDE